MSEVFKSETGFDYTGQWWIWVVLMTVIVFLLTYRDIRISTTAGVILGCFEIGIFAALAIWMLLSNAGDLNLQPFNPSHADGDWGGVFKGMVFAILAFIGFEAVCAARGGGEEPTAHGAAGRGRLGDRDRPLLRALRVRLGLRRRLRQLRRRRRRAPTRGGTSARCSGARAGSSSSSRSATRSPRTRTRR